MPIVFQQTNVKYVSAL